MDWLDSVFRYPAANLLFAVMVVTSLLSLGFAVFARKMSWDVAGFWGGFVAFVFFSVMLTVYNGVRSTAAIGGMFMIVYVSIAAFPTAGIARLVMRMFRKPERAD